MAQDIVVKGSIADAAGGDISVEEAFMKADVVAMIDISGSMHAEDFYPSSDTRWDRAVKELERIQEAYPGRVALLSFADYVQFHPGGKPTGPMGGTSMHTVLEVARMADVPGMTFILISDGLPNSEEIALHEARQFTQAINTIFIGPEDDAYGRRFLEELASATGGASSNSASITNELLSFTQLLLEAKDG